MIFSKSGWGGGLNVLRSYMTISWAHADNGYDMQMSSKNYEESGDGPNLDLLAIS